MVATVLGTSDAVAGTVDEYAAIRDNLARCAACHGETGAKPLPGNPILAGQNFYYLYVQLKDFKAGRRDNPVMSPIATALEKPQMQALAKFFSERPWPRTGIKSDPGLTKRSERGITAGQCVACHLGNFEGNSRVPRLAGQMPDYLQKTMLDFKTKPRKNSPAKGSLMASFDEHDIAAMADYLGGY
jgi:cytochrome c553